ncbi:Transmembrane protein 65 [Bagarius yarrelli]|uniref:Transmembrane protein 65 n=1 Tax=Bagarius yarrelli TaxID=175774 RepID=A0A556TUP9_BAGYA|nr:Transmembrane protein 65 [Bagarius yarrelli]
MIGRRRALRHFLTDFNRGVTFPVDSASAILLHNAIPFIGFGFLDNAIMIAAVRNRMPLSIMHTHRSTYDGIPDLSPKQADMWQTRVSSHTVSNTALHSNLYHHTNQTSPHQSDFTTPIRPHHTNQTSPHQSDFTTPIRLHHTNQTLSPPTPSQTLSHQSDLTTHQSDLITPIRVTQQSPYHTNQTLSHQSDFTTPIRLHHTNQTSPHQSDLITPIRLHHTNQTLSHQSDLITPIRPYHTNQTLSTPIRHLSDLITPIRLHHTNQTLSHQSDFTTPIRPYHTNQTSPHQSDLITPIRPYHTNQTSPHQSDLITPIRLHHPNQTFPQQSDMGKAIGVGIGCILGMFPLLFYKDDEEKTDDKAEDPPPPDSAPRTSSGLKFLRNWSMRMFPSLLSVIKREQSRFFYHFTVKGRADRMSQPGRLRAEVQRWWLTARVFKLAALRARVFYPHFLPAHFLLFKRERKVVDMKV